MRTRIPRFHEVLKDFSPVQSGDSLFDAQQEQRPPLTEEEARKHWRKFAGGSLLMAAVVSFGLSQCNDGPARPDKKADSSTPSLFEACVDNVMSLPQTDPMAPSLLLAPIVIDRCSGAYSFENPGFSIPEIHDAAMATIEEVRGDD